MKVALLSLLLLVGCVSAATKDQERENQESIRTLKTRIAFYDEEIDRLAAEAAAAEPARRSSIALELQRVTQWRENAQQRLEEELERAREIDEQRRQDQKESAEFGWSLLFPLLAMVIPGVAGGGVRK